MGFGAESAHGILGEASRPRPRDRRDRRLPRRSRAGLMRYDVAIVGAGIAGASLAAEAAPHASVLLIEAEDAPGYHATGRSAAFWSETDRKSVGEGKSVAGRVDLGGRRVMKKKK